MKINLLGWKKTGEEGSLTHLQHEQGHEMTINHSILSPKMRGEIKALPSAQKDVSGNKHPDKKPAPHLAEGGEVKQEENPIDENKVVQDLANGPDAADKRILEQTAEEAKVKDLEKKAEEDKAKADYEAYKAKQPETEDTRPGRETSAQDSNQGNIDHIIASHKNLTDSHNAIVQAFSKSQPQPQAQPEPQPQQPQINITEGATPGADQTAAGPVSQPTSQPVPQSAPTSTPAVNNNIPSVTPPDTTGIPTQIPSTYNKDMAAAQQGIQTIQDYHMDQEKKNQALYDKIVQDKIDPDRYWNNQNTGSKITTAIGLILGGLGAGATGGKNLAVDALNHIIERDVDAQKSNLAQGNTLYKMNLEATKDATEARAMTVNQQLTMAQAMLSKRASDNQSSLSQLEAQKAVQDIQKLKLENNMGAFKAKMFNEIGNTTSTNLPPGKIDLSKFNKYTLSGVMPKEDVTAATKEAGNYQLAEELRRNMDQSARHLDKQIGAGVFTPSDRQSAIQAFAGRIAKIAEGRFNLEESKLQAHALLPSPLDAPNTVKNKTERRKQFFDSLVETPTLERYHLKAPRESNSSVQTMNGIPYQLGADGQYHRVK